MEIFKRKRIKKRVVSLQTPTDITVIKENTKNIKRTQHGYTILSNKQFIWKNKIQSIMHSNEDKEDFMTMHIKMG